MTHTTASTPQTATARSPETSTHDESVRPFTVAIPQVEIDDLHDRLLRTRFAPSAPGDDWAYGVPTSWVAELVEYWRTEFDWRALEEKGPAVHVRVAVPAALAEAAALSAVVSAAAFRIAQEAVTNARRHARAATRIDLDVSIRDGCLHLNVQDDGAPVSTTRQGYGITGMVERARLVGGTCRAAPDPNGGWRVTAVLPAGGATQ